MFAQNHLSPCDFYFIFAQNLPRLISKYDPKYETPKRRKKNFLSQVETRTKLLYVLWRRANDSRENYKYVVAAKYILVDL